MTFLAPWFLLGLLAAVIPPVLHLRRAQKRSKIVFSTTAFFDEQFLKTARRAQVQDLLLMFLRMALFALLALGLSQPLLRMPWMASLLAPLSGKQTVAIVLDDSASMSVADAGGMLLDRAKNGAIEIVDSLSTARGDTATVILAGARATGPKVLFDPPTSDLEQVKEALRTIQITDLGTDLAAGIQAAGQVLASANDRQIYVLSDFAATAVPEQTGLTTDPLTTLLLVSTRPKESPAPNVSIDAIQYGAPRPMLGVPFTFRVQVTNATPDAHKLGLNLVVDDHVVAHRDVEVPAGRSQVSRFVHRFSQAGWHRGRIEWDGVPADGEPAVADALPADNRRYFALAVEDRLKVLAVDGAPSELPSADELLFFRVAMTLSGSNRAAADVAPGEQPGERVVTLDAINAPQLATAKLDDYSLVLLANVANLAPPAVTQLERYVDQGGSLLITLGDRVDREQYNRLVGAERLHGGLLPGQLLEKVEQPAAGFLAWVDDSHPATAGFSSGALGSLTAVTFSARYRVERGIAESLMQTDSGDPLLLEKRFGRGRVMLFASSIDRDWTNLPLQPLFVPWVYRLVGYLAQPQAGGAGFYTTGATIALPASVLEEHAPRILTPGGATAFATPESGPSGPVLMFSQTEKAGIYTISEDSASAKGAGPAYALAANIPARESQTSYATKDAAVIDPRSTVWIDQPEGIAHAVEQARHGIGVWDALLLVALAVALVEPWLANRLSRSRSARVPNALGRRDQLPTPLASGHEAA